MKWKKFNPNDPLLPKDGQSPIGVMRNSLKWPSVLYWSPVFGCWMTMIVEIQEDGTNQGTLYPVQETDIIRWTILPKFGEIEE